MTQKFQNKYRIASARWKDWDYGSNAIYFVTICTYDRERHFGQIVETPNLGVSENTDNKNISDSGVSQITRPDGNVENTPKLNGDNIKTPQLGLSTNTMELNGIGEIAEKYWMEIPNHFPFVQLHEFVVMPNHIHALIEIVDTPNLGVSEKPQLGGDDEKTPNFDGDVEKTPKLGVSTEKNWKPGTLGVIINQYKRICTINARKINPKFKWQSRYYDHVVRDFDEYHRIEQYIQNNPKNWKDDDLNSKPPE